jgi:hypothetical protein
VQPSVTLSIRPASFVSVSLGPSFNSQFISTQYVQTVDDATATSTYNHRYVFGELRQTTFSADTRVNWTFTPALSLELYAQPFASTGRFTNFKQLDRPATAEFGVYGASRGTITHDATRDEYAVDPDGTGPAKTFLISKPNSYDHSLRGNAVVRWEYRPGSTVYFVWQQESSGSQPIGDFSFNRDMRAILHEPVTNTFLVKLTYWLGL